MTVSQIPAKIMAYALMELILLRVNVKQGLLEQIVKRVRIEIICIFKVYNVSHDESFVHGKKEKRKEEKNPYLDSPLKITLKRDQRKINIG